MALTPKEAAKALDAAEASKARLAGRLEVPSAFFASIGAAIAVQLGSAAVGISGQDTRGALQLLAGAAAFALTAAVQLARFRHRNGVWLAGLASRAVLGGGTAASSLYVAALGAAVWAAFEEAWWVVVVASIAGGVGYGLCGRRWLHSYRGDPGTYGRPESTALLVLVAVAAIAGVLALVFVR